MHVVVGVGIAGAWYVRTRHKVGFDVVGELAKRAGTELKEKRFNGRIGKGQLVLQPVWLAQPQTWMNRSGDCVGPMAGYFKIPPARVVVIHDELDLPFGVVKVKLGGGHGGHNGLRDISKKLGKSAEYARIRVGIGRPDGRMDPADWVLARWKPAQVKELPFILDRAADAVEWVVRDGVTEAMNRWNGEAPVC